MSAVKKGRTQGKWLAVEWAGQAWVVRPSGVNQPIATGMRQADAQLMAAAPELLATLARCVDLLEPYGDEEAAEPGSIGEALQEARAALAKARGES